MQSVHSTPLADWSITSLGYKAQKNEGITLSFRKIYLFISFKRSWIFCDMRGRLPDGPITFSSPPLDHTTLRYLLDPTYHFCFSVGGDTNGGLLLTRKVQELDRVSCMFISAVSKSHTEEMLNKPTYELLWFYQPLQILDKVGTASVPRYTSHNIVTTHDLSLILGHQHGYPWSSLTTPPYRSSLLAGPQGYIPYPHKTAVCMFELVVLIWLGHGGGP